MSGNNFNITDNQAIDENNPQSLENKEVNGVTLDSSGDGSLFLSNDGQYSSPMGGGDVVGPVGATDQNVVIFDGTTGKIIADSGIAISAVLQSGDNVSELANDAGYVTAGANVSIFVNDANYLASGDNVSELTNDANYVPSGSNISVFVNDSGYIAAGANVSLLVNDANYTASGDNILVFVNDANYIASGDNISLLVNDVGYITTAGFTMAGDIDMGGNDINNAGALNASSSNLSGTLSAIQLKARSVGTTGVIFQAGAGITVDQNIVWPLNPVTPSVVISNSGTISYQQLSDFLQAGDNVSELVNDANYVASGANISVFVNDASYTSIGDDVSVFNNDANYFSTSSDNSDAISEGTTNLFLTSSERDKIAELGFGWLQYSTSTQQSTSGAGGNLVLDFDIDQNSFPNGLFTKTADDEFQADVDMIAEVKFVMDVDGAGNNQGVEGYVSVNNVRVDPTAVRAFLRSNVNESVSLTQGGYLLNLSANDIVRFVLNGREAGTYILEQGNDNASYAQVRCIQLL